MELHAREASRLGRQLRSAVFNVSTGSPRQLDAGCRRRDVSPGPREGFKWISFRWLVRYPAKSLCHPIYLSMHMPWIADTAFSRDCYSSPCPPTKECQPFNGHPWKQCHRSGHPWWQLGQAPSSRYPCYRSTSPWCQASLRVREVGGSSSVYLLIVFGSSRCQIEVVVVRLA